MATYQELMKQAESLLAEADKIRQKEIEDFIAEVKTKMTHYGISAHDMGFTPNGKSSAYTPVIKYIGPDGQTWVGGRGRKPDWVMAALKAGKRLEDFEIKKK